jgi:hypothetical protein
VALAGIIFVGLGMPGLIDGFIAANGAAPTLGNGTRTVRERAKLKR